MTMDKQKGDIEFCCDVCGQVLQTKTSNFEAARNLLRRERWTAIKIDEEWEHRCGECK